MKCRTCQPNRSKSYACFQILLSTDGRLFNAFYSANRNFGRPFQILGWNNFGNEFWHHTIWDRWPKLRRVPMLSIGSKRQDGPGIRHSKMTRLWRSIVTLMEFLDGLILCAHVSFWPGISMRRTASRN